MKIIDEQKIGLVIILLVVSMSTAWFGWRYLSGRHEPEVDVIKEVDVSSLRHVIITDKKTYHVNESMEVVFLLYNDRPYPVKFESRSINEIRLTGFSISHPWDRITAIQDRDYLIEYLTVPANSGRWVTSITFFPKYPGKFFISIMRKWKIVNVIE